MNQTEKELKYLKIYSFITSILLLAIIVFLVTKEQNKKITELDVERINIIEPDGKLKMVISNQSRQHPGILNGKVIPRKGPRGAGLIFFNHRGDETGGLQYQGHDEYGHYATVAFDKLGHDQTIALQHQEDKEGRHQIGLRMWQRPNNTVWESIEVLNEIKKIKDPKLKELSMQKARKEGKIHATRLFLGKRKDNSVELVLSDQLARPRIILKVKEDGNPIMEFLSESGKVVNSFP